MKWKRPWEGSCGATRIWLSAPRPRHRRPARRHPPFLLPSLQELDVHPPRGAYAFVNVRPSMLDEHRWFAPFIEVWTDEKLPWAATLAVHSFPTEPDFADYARLIDDFAAHGARPGRAQQ